MARLSRLCVPGCPHVLIQQGHNHQPVFRDAEDRQLFLGLLREASTSHGVVIHAYGLFEAEVRMLVTPHSGESLSRMMQAIGRRYGTAFNRRHGHVGSLWEGRFRATPIEPERHLLSCMRFVERWPTDPDLGTGLGRRDWSSAGHHLGQGADPLISDHLVYWSLGNTPFEREAAYRHSTQQALTQEEEARISDATRKGWPLGSPAFIEHLSESTERRLTPLPRGRPRRAAKSSI